MMKRLWFATGGLLLAVSLLAQEVPPGRGLSDANKERLVLEDMEDLGDWGNGSPVETTIARTSKHVKTGKYSLLFANRVDHTQGEAKYPIGWPRINKDLAKAKLSDWSDYDYFECWIYTETSRPALPNAPLGVSFAHTGQKRSTSAILRELKKDEWVKVLIPISKLDDPKDVQRIQFNFSESNYQHGDKVDFFINDLVLTRYVQPAVNTFSLDRELLYSNDRVLTARYTLVGRQGLESLAVELEIGREPGKSVARSVGMPPQRQPGRIAPQAELPLVLAQPLTPGEYWAHLNLRAKDGKLVDQKAASLRVIPGVTENGKR